MFPFAPSPHDDLRDLFGFQRAERTARNLGLSSITRGEGSLDLYETDDGPVTHRYGDLPGGGFGVGITHRGNFANVSDLIGAGEDRDDAQDGRLDSHAGRIGATETKNAQQDGRLDDHASRIGAVEGDAGSLGTRISNAEDRLDGHASRIGATENKNTAQDGRLDSHVSRIGALENRMSALEDDTAHKMAQINYWLSVAQNAPGLPPWGGW